MAGQMSALRRQVRSVRSTQKLTNAMALVATAKLQKQKGKMYENSTYAEAYYELLLTALSAVDENDPNPYFTGNDADNPLHIIITSNSGLCGSYNMDLLKYVEANVDKMDPIFAIGNYGIKWLDANGYMVIKRFNDVDDVNPRLMEMVIYDVLELYRQKEISSIDIIYTQYINTLTFSPSTFQILPIDRPEHLERRDIELAPDKDTVFDALVTHYTSAQVYSTFLEAKTSEHAARRSAMDSANRNAQQLIEDITLQYNQARQAMITQEVNEITAGADAL